MSHAPLFRRASLRLSARRRQVRRRGYSLIEVMLGVIVILVTVPGINWLITNNQRIQQDTISGRQLADFGHASRNYVAENYDVLRDAMVGTVTDGTVNPSDGMVRVLTMTELAEDGFISAPLVSAGEPRNAQGQEYRLMVRGVLRSDTGFPQSTVTKSQISAMAGLPDANGNTVLTNDVFNPADDELDLEAILVTVGGTALPTVRAARVVAATGSSVAVDIRSESDILVATGAFGNFSMPVDPWLPVMEAEGTPLLPGRMAMLVSMSGTGDRVLGIGAGGNDKDSLKRCADLLETVDGDSTAPAYQDCLNDGNLMYSSIVFHETTAGVRPVISGLNTINCREEDSDGVLVSDTGTLTINCPSLAVEGDLEVDGSGRIQQDLTVGGELRAAPAAITMGGENISTALIVEEGTVKIGEEIPLPSQARTDALCGPGINPADLDVEALPVGMIESAARPISGFRTYIDRTSEPGSLLARMISFTTQDWCTTMQAGAIWPRAPFDAGDASNIEQGDLEVVRELDADGNPIYDYPNAGYTGAPRSCLDYDGSGVVTSTQGDGLPDAYWVREDQGMINYRFMCTVTAPATP